MDTLGDFEPLFMVFRPLAVVADVIPMVGDMLRVGLGLFSGLVTASLSLLTISVAWIFYRPLLGIPLLLLSAGAVVGLFFLGKKKAASALRAVDAKEPLAKVA